MHLSSVPEDPCPRRLHLDEPSAQRAVPSSAGTPRPDRAATARLKSRCHDVDHRGG